MLLLKQLPCSISAKRAQCHTNAYLTAAARRRHMTCHTCTPDTFQQECSNTQPPALDMSMQQQLAVALQCNTHHKVWQHEMSQARKTEVSAWDERCLEDALAYDIIQEVCFACCHASSSIHIDVHEVHMQMVIGGVVMYVGTYLLSCHAILVFNCLIRPGDG